MQFRPLTATLSLAGEPAELEPGFAPRDENHVSPLVYDVMTYADR